MTNEFPAAPSAPSPTRRRLAGASLIAAAAAGLAQAALQPVGSDGSAAESVHAMVASPGLASAAQAFDALNWLLAVPGIIAIFGYLRGRGRVLGAIGTVLATLGAVASTFGVGGEQVQLRVAELDPAVAARVNDTLGDAPLFPAFLVLIYLGLIGLVLVTIAAMRGGLVRWWVPAIYLVGLAANVLLDNGLYGLPAAALYVLPGVAEILLAIGLFRAGSTVSPLTRPARRVVRRESVAA